MIYIFIYETLPFECPDCKRETTHDILITKAVIDQVAFLKICIECRKTSLAKLTPEDWNKKQFSSEMVEWSIKGG